MKPEASATRWSLDQTEAPALPKIETVPVVPAVLLPLPPRSGGGVGIISLSRRPAPTYSESAPIAVMAASDEENDTEVVALPLKEMGMPFCCQAFARQNGSPLGQRCM